MHIIKGTADARKISIFRIVLVIILCNLSVSFASAQTATDTSKKAMAMLDTTKPAAPPSSPLSTPGMTGPLTINPEPLKLKSGWLGDVYVSGAISAFGQLQNNAANGDHKFQVDLPNAQVFVQKVDGWFQWFVQVGSYSTPDIGLPYFRSGNYGDSVVTGTTNLLYGVVPQAFIKLAPCRSPEASPAIR